MGSSAVMRGNPHSRFFVNGRGALMERFPYGPARRTRFGIEASGATRSELLAMADQLNRDPALNIDDAAIEFTLSQRIEAQRHV